MRTRSLWSVIMAGLLGTTLVPFMWGQTTSNADRLANVKATLDQIKSGFDSSPRNHRALLDGGSHAVQLARVFDKFVAKAAVGVTVSRKEFSQAIAQSDPDLAAANDRSTDLDFSGFDGVTQSETHTAMCGNQVVVGFNDSGSLFQTAFFGTGGLSFSGAAVSSDRGKTFRDIGAVNAGPDTNSLVVGDPVVTCSDPSTFYYTQLFEVGGSFFTPGSTAIAISKSTDGGNTWGDPVAAAAKPAQDFRGIGHFLDKPWSAIDPSNPKKIYVSYTDFDDSLTSAVCGKQPRTAIEVVLSVDGGQTFGSPIVIDEVCGDSVAVQASHVAVNSHGVAYIAWERFNLATNDIRITHLNPNGTPAAATVIDQKIFGGDVIEVFRGSQGIEAEFDLQGQFRNLVGLDLAIDRSGGPNDGTVYVTWDDGRNKSGPDLLGFTIQGLPPDQPGLVLPFTPAILTAGNYFYTDILVVRAKDGVHFGPAIQVNSDQQPQLGGGHDHFQPAIATDPSGSVAICWYDRRNDPRNFEIERFCAESKNGSNGWVNFKVPIVPFSPLHRLDFVVNPAYMGDYDGLTSDFTGATKGFIGAFQWMSSGMNPDVKAFDFL